MNDTEAKRGPVAALNYPRQHKALLGHAKGVLAAIIAGAYFPNAGPLLLAFEKDIDAYDDAETQAATRVVGAVALRNAKRKKVIEDLHHLRDHVQGVVEAQVSPADAVAMIVGAGMFVRKVGKRHKPALEARNVSPSGTVLLQARSLGPKVVYHWQYSTDQLTWTDAPETLKARILLDGLSPVTTYFFRFRALTPAGPVDFSQVVRLLVV